MNTYNQYNQQTNMQSTTVNQTIHVIQDYQTPQISSTNNVFQNQGNVIMTQYSFFYKVHNNFQIYHITCKEILF